MQIAVFGDIHCKYEYLERLIEDLNRDGELTHLAQVGDFGYMWPKTRKIIDTKGLSLNFCHGNHEAALALNQYPKDFFPNIVYRPFGSITEIDGYRIMWAGGASSIDWEYRTSGVDWFPDHENISKEQLDFALSQKKPIHAIICHEHPDKIVWNETFPIFDIGRGNRIALQELLDHFKPEFLFHGHYHLHDHGIYRHADGFKTKWVCLNTIENADYVIWDGMKLIGRQIRVEDPINAKY